MKYIYLTLAFLCLICGSVGIVIPGLPTTPLLLAASFFFAKGSDRFHRWFLGTKLYHKHLESFVQHKTMKLRTKVYILMIKTTPKQEILSVSQFQKKQREKIKA